MKEKIKNLYLRIYSYLKTVDNLYMKTIFTIIAFALILICIGIFNMIEKLEEIDSSIYYLR